MCEGLSYVYRGFQSSPSPKAGSYQSRHNDRMEWIVSILSQPEGRELPVTSSASSAVAASFNPLPARRPGATKIENSDEGLPRFQSSPSPKAGSYIAWSSSIITQWVSILSQPEGRELLKETPSQHVYIVFQSSPSPKAGSYMYYTPDGEVLCVSILSQPEGRELRNWKPASVCKLLVSILSQPEGRELLRLASWSIAYCRFNPLPARRPGATIHPEYSYGRLGFQSSPSPKAGSYPISRIRNSLISSFQSSPSPKAGSYSSTGPSSFIISCFNPLPARRPGATSLKYFGDVRSLFQSSPSPKAGSYIDTRRRPPDKGVSILSQPEGRELPEYDPDRFQGFHVSILSQPEGRELRTLLCNPRDFEKFQSSPSPKAGSYEPDSDGETVTKEFQSSPSPKAGSYCSWSWRWRIATLFQSSPSPKAGSYHNVGLLLYGSVGFNPLPARRPGATLISSGFSMA